jgi:hypothetical protein
VEVVHQGAADEAADGMGLPVGGVHNLLDRGPIGALEHADHLRLLAPSTRGRLSRSRAFLLVFGVRFAGSVFERCPDAVYGRLPVGESFYIRDTGQAVPDVNQASHRPLGRALAQLIQAAEMVVSLGFGVAFRLRNVIVEINRKRRHDILSLPA